MKYKKKVYSLNTELYKVTGVQKVLMDIHQAIKNEYDSLIVGTLAYEEIDENHRIDRSEYIRLRNPFMFYNSIVILHERKLLPFFWLLNHLFFQQIKIIYVHHSILYGWKLTSIIPKVVVAISERGRENLEKYFSVKKEYIHKIYNCVKDIHPAKHRFTGRKEIILLYPARINNVKRQVEIVHRLKGRLSEHIKILFAGIGPNYEELKKEIAEDSQFVALGFRNDIYNLLQECDYMMLFSEYEGLPISLIEATMCGTPIVCNDVGGNCEIAYDGENAFVVNEWDKLIETLNKLPEISEIEYRRMSDEGRNIYKKNFTFDAFKQNYLNLLNEL